MGERPESADVIDPTHPEDRCQACGGPNIVWFTDSALWNRVNGSPNGILCPMCFVALAEAIGVPNAGWKLTPDLGGET
jgi:hypothetical protein